MKLKSKATLGSLLITSMAAAAVALPSAAQAAQPGDLCSFDPQYGNEFAVNAGDGASYPLYYLPVNAGFRIVSYANYNTYYGHGNGMPDGYVYRAFIRQASCHQ
jgi:hypothetical protein